MNGCASARTPLEAYLILMPLKAYLILMAYQA